MRIVEIRERSVPVSRFPLDHHQPGPLTTSIVAITTDVMHNGLPIVGYGFGSVGRFAQSGLIRERFAPRLLNASDEAISNADGTNIDPFRAWKAMMTDEKPGGHGERCVAIGALDMALWDAAAKIADKPLYAFLGGTLGRDFSRRPKVSCYASGGYRYPVNDHDSLQNEMRRIVDRGFTHAKIKIGTCGLSEDLKRIETAMGQLPSGGSNLAVDAMNAYSREQGLQTAKALSQWDIWWFEDICDPLDFETHAHVAANYDNPIATGEALFSLSEAKLLACHGGLRRDHDVLVFDPVHCYGLPGYLQIVDHFIAQGWSRTAFWPHGGHLFCQHVVAALGLGGAEVNLSSFQPLCGLPDATIIENGQVILPDIPGIGFEGQNEAFQLFTDLLETAPAITI